MTKKICIAGKNNIAINVCEYIISHYKDIEILTIFNKNDNGENSFQRSFKAYSKLKRLKEVTLNEIYDIPDIIFLSLEFDRIIKPDLFISKQLYNIHFSLLPEYKGMYTSALPILNSESYSGVTFHYIDKGIDTGDIISQQKINIDDELNCEQLYNRYIEEGSKLVIKSMNDVLNNSIKAAEQPKSKSSYYSKKAIDYENVKIDLNNTAYKIKRQINAFVFPSYQLPEVYKNLVYKSEILDRKSTLKPGIILNETFFYFDIATIDFDLRIYKDLRADLFIIAKNGNISKLKEFINNNYDIHQRSKEGWDIAIIAAYNSQYEFLDYLINEHNWDINTINYNGTTLPMYLMTAASRNSKIDFFKNFLNKNKVNLHIKDYYNHDIYYYAEKQNNPLVLEILQK